MEYNITFRQKDKGWQYIISYKEGDKWKQKSKQGYKTKKEAKPDAENALSELKKAIENNKTIVNTKYSSIIFKQLASVFLEHNKLYKERNTIKSYKSSISNFKAIEDKQVKDIKKIDITPCIDEMTINLKYVSVKKYVNMTKIIFDYYIENYDPNYINPIHNVKLKKDKNVTDKKALSKFELDNLLKKLKDSKYYIVAFIAANTGLRCGEILGLTWNDVNKKDMTISVTKQWKVLKDGKSNFGDLKSKNSNRHVPISAKFLNELDKYDKSNPRALNNRITPFSKTQIDRRLNPKLKELAGISIHELRHTYATLLIANGVDFKTVAKLMGHDVKQTLETYSHVTDEMLKNVSEKICEIF